MKMQKRKGGGGSNWMDTYGDMVTLLLCFFVLLYSISSIDETKYMAVMKSFNPEALETDLDEGGTKGPIDSDGKNDIEDEENISQADVDQALEALYQELKDYAAASNSAKNIEITKGDGYVFVSFDDAVFFDGDSFALRPQGEQVLGDISGIFNKVAQYIDEIRIMGHTAQARADSPNDVTADRFLASNRATIATLYIQEHSKDIEPARLISVGYGQHRPVDTNDTAESRSHNRRVEVMITGRQVTDELGDSVNQYYSLRDGEKVDLTRTS